MDDLGGASHLNQPTHLSSQEALCSQRPAAPVQQGLPEVCTHLGSVLPTDPGACICTRLLTARTLSWCGAPCNKHKRREDSEAAPAASGHPILSPPATAGRGPDRFCTAARCSGQGNRSWAEAGPGVLGEFSCSQVSFRKAKPVLRLKGKQSVTLSVISFSCRGAKPGDLSLNPGHPHGQ